MYKPNESILIDRTPIHLRQELSNLFAEINGHNLGKLHAALPNTIRSLSQKNLLLASNMMRERSAWYKIIYSVAPSLSSIAAEKICQFALGSTLSITAPLSFISLLIPILASSATLYFSHTHLENMIVNTKAALSYARIKEFMDSKLDDEVSSKLFTALTYLHLLSVQQGVLKNFPIQQHSMFSNIGVTAGIQALVPWFDSSLPTSMFKKYLGEAISGIYLLAEQYSFGKSHECEEREEQVVQRWSFIENLTMQELMKYVIADLTGIFYQLETVNKKFDQDTQAILAKLLPAEPHKSPESLPHYQTLCKLASQLYHDATDWQIFDGIIEFKKLPGEIKSKINQFKIRIKNLLRASAPAGTELIPTAAVPMQVAAAPVQQAREKKRKKKHKPERFFTPPTSPPNSPPGSPFATPLGSPLLSRAASPQPAITSASSPFATPVHSPLVSRTASPQPATTSASSLLSNFMPSSTASPLPATTFRAASALTSPAPLASHSPTLSSPSPTRFSPPLLNTTATQVPTQKPGEDYAVLITDCDQILKKYKEQQITYINAFTNNWFYAQIEGIMLVKKFLSNSALDYFAQQNNLREKILAQHKDPADFGHSSSTITSAYTKELNSIVQEHFALMLRIISSVNNTQPEMVQWLTSFFPTVFSLHPETNELLALAVFLADRNLLLYEAGTSIFWPALAEDIDLVVVPMNNQTMPDIEANLTDFFIPRNWQLVTDRPSSPGMPANRKVVTYWKAGYRNIDILLCADRQPGSVDQKPSCEIVQATLTERPCNFSAALRDVLTGWTTIMLSDAEFIKERNIILREGSVLNPKFSKHIAKIYGKYWFLKRQGDNYELAKKFTDYIKNLNNIHYTNISLYHLLEIINESASDKKIDFFWSGFIKAIQAVCDLNGKLLLSPSTSTVDAAKQKLFQIFAKHLHMQVNGWVYLCLHLAQLKVPRLNAFLRHPKLGLLPWQQNSIQKICTAIRTNQPLANLIGFERKIWHIVNAYLSSQSHLRHD